MEGDKEMKKKICVLIIMCMLSIFLSVPANAAVGDEIRASKKIISVVYDDSGSMTGARWSYTNYAMQSLIALLNEQDELYITFMTDPETSEAVDTSDLTSAIKKIHDLSEMGETPGKALDTARNKLDTISESDTSSQFWLVIITDGQIDMTMTLQNKLDSFKNNTMSNSTGLNVVYLGMGDAVKAVEDRGNNLYTYEADSDTEIVGTLQEVATLISGRLNADEVKQIDDKTISIKSTLPLYSISILSQKSAAKVTQAKTKEEKLNVQRNISIDATDLLYGESLKSLYGNASVINKVNDKNDAQIIPAGSYTVSFSEKIDINDMNIQIEPAIALKAEISRNGVVIDDTSKLNDGDVVDIKIVPVIPGTDIVIPDSDLPKQIDWTIEYEIDGTVVDSGKGTVLSGVKIGEGSNLVRGTINIPGYAPFINEVSFEIKKIVYNLDIKTDQPENLSYNRSDIGKLKLDDSNTIKFQITNDGKPLTKAEQQSIGVELTISDLSCQQYEDSNIVYTAGKTMVKCELVQNDDGSYSIIPGSPFLTPAISLQAGTYTVEVSIADMDIKATGTFTVVPSMEEAKDIPKIIIGILLFLYLMYLLFIKKHFKGQTVHYECWRIKEDGSGSMQKSSTDSIQLGFFSGHFLLPAKACYVTYKNLKLVAESDGIIIVTGKSIAKAVEKFGRSPSKPERNLRSISDRLIKTVRKNNKREASDQSLSKDRLYFADTVDSRDIWCIYMTND